MQPVDPKTYLWKTVTGRLRVPESTGVDAALALLKEGGISRGTVQRLREGETSVGVDQLSKLAALFKIEVWELLVPPGTSVSAPAVAANSTPLEDALVAVASALQRVAPTGRLHLLEALANYADDPSKKGAALNYVLEELGGAPPPESGRKRVNE